MRIVVDLPQPFEPRKPKISPSGILKLTWFTAVKDPNLFVRFSASIEYFTSPSVTSGGTVISLCPRRRSSGRSRMNASSRFEARVRARISCGVPVARMRPPSIAISQSKRCASSMYAVATTTPICGCSSRMRATRSQNCRRASGSTPVVGSSSTRRSGSWMSEQQSPSFCFMPPESLPAGRSRKL